MNINVKKVFLYNDDSFEKNKVDDNKYELIRYVADREKQIMGNILHDRTVYLYNRSLELIKAIEIFQQKETRITDDMNSLPSISHRQSLIFDSLLQKQLFINHFVFSKPKNFVSSLIAANISKENIETLLSMIIDKKESAKEDNDYNLEIDDDIINMTELCRYYNCNYPTLIINRLFELYYKENGLFDKLQKKR